MATVAAHVFLSPGWIRAVKQIRHELDLAAQATDAAVRANVTITDAPFDATTVLGHLDTSSGTLVLNEGHLDEADFAMEMPYSLAYELFVERDPAAVVGVLVGGQVILTGDSSKILLLADFALPSETVPPETVPSETVPPDGPLETAEGPGSTARRIIEQIDAITQRQ